MTDAEEEPALIEKARLGDDDAFAALMDLHAPAVYRFCLRYLGDASDAEDATQEAFYKAWRNLGTFNSAQKFRTWVFTIAKNAATDLLRKRRSLPFSTLTGTDDSATFEENLPDPEPLPDELFERAELETEVRRALAMLSPRDRLTLSLRYEESLPFADIAPILGITPDTARSVHRRACIRLRAALSAHAPK